jgi:hypothetical protein
MLLAPWWLAVAGLPVFHRPFPDAPHSPAAIALVAGEVSLRRPCLRLRCAGAEWLPPSPATTYAYRSDDHPVQRTPLPGQPMRGFGLSAPASRREWTTEYASDVGVGAGYGVEALRRPDTQLRIEVGPAYRLQPYVDHGTATPGPVARGRLELQQRLGDRARLEQRLQVETGRENTVVRNAVGVSVELEPRWTLRSDLELQHDSAAEGGSGRTETEGSVRLQYAF